MGTVIKVTGADYSVNNVNNEGYTGLNVVSANIADITYNRLTGALSLRNSGASDNFNFAASSSITDASVTMSTSTPAAFINTVVIGIDTSGNGIVLYLDGTGRISRFSKTGIINTSEILVTVSPAPNVAKGTPVNITHLANSFTISYSGYTKTVTYASIPTWSYPVIGVLATGTTATNYILIVNN